MELKSLVCPNCGAVLDDDGLDTFFCIYCGYKIILQGQSEAAYDAKMRMKHMEHEERLQDKHNAQERYRMELELKNNRLSIVRGFIVLSLGIVMCLTLYGVGNTKIKKQEQELQAIVEQIMIDIENEDFAAAYVKANSLYWDESWTSEGKEKWDATRKEIIKQIKEAEKDADDVGFWDLFK